MAAYHGQQHISQPASPLSPVVNLLLPLLKWQTGGLMLLCVAFAVFCTGGKKNKLAFGRQAGRTEKTNAFKTAQKQILQHKHNRVTLYIGTPKSRGWGAKFSTMLGTCPSLYVPNAQEGIVVCGSPGKGKTFSVIDPLIRSSLDQGFPTIVYDFKGDPAPRPCSLCSFSWLLRSRFCAREAIFRRLQPTGLFAG